MMKIKLLLLTLFCATYLFAQHSLINSDEELLNSLTRKLSIDTMRVSKYNRTMEDSIIQLRKFTGFPTNLKETITCLAVRDFFISRYSNVVVFANEITATNSDLQKLKNYLLICSYCHQNDFMKLGKALRKGKISNDSELYHALQYHCLSKNINLNQLLTNYQNSLKKENKSNNKMVTTAIIAGASGFIVGVAATVSLFIFLFTR